MVIRSRILFGLVGAGLSLLLGSTPVREARATTVEALSLEQLVLRSPLIVQGRVEAIRSSWDESGRRIFTQATVLVTEVLRGSARVPEARPGQPLVVFTPGGAVGELAQLAVGAARFAPGEEVLLFLVRLPRGWSPVGLAQGKFVLQADDRGVVHAVRDLIGLHYPAVTGTDPFPPREELPLEEVRDAIRRHAF